MADNKEAVIISAARTPTGKFQGALKPFTAPELGAIAIKEAVKRAGVDPTKIDAGRHRSGTGATGCSESRSAA
jgi:acetyl-CoA C-acetyltransferase